MAGGGGDATAPRGNLRRGEAARQVSDRTKLRKEQKNGKESDLAFNPFIPLRVNTSSQSRGPRKVSGMVRESTTRIREYQAHQTCAPSHGSALQLLPATLPQILLSAGQLQNATALYSLHPPQHFHLKFFFLTFLCYAQQLPLLVSHLPPCPLHLSVLLPRRGRSLGHGQHPPDPLHQQTPAVGSSCCRAASAAPSRQGTVASWLVDKRKRSKIKISFQKVFPSLPLPTS